MDPKRLFLTLAFGLLGGYWVWQGASTLRRLRPKGGAARRGSAAQWRAAGRLVVGLLILLAVSLLYAPERTTP
jgi:hypothetical protein